ncbi:MAG: hypothetical protein JKY41_04165 [Rhodobacteraceae bacterium]|nr:hypothetical protein [Paracoccaceae bacterium]
MEDIASIKTGWKPIPMALKVLFVVLALWSFGAVMNLPNLMNNGLPLFGVFVFGTPAFLVVLLLDFIGPLTFLYALWNRKEWAAKWAFTYMGIFMLNSVVAFFTVGDQLGGPQILIPTVVTAIFVAVIYWKRQYFDGEH